MRLSECGSSPRMHRPPTLTLLVKTRKRLKTILFVLFGLACVWALGDLVYSSIVAYRIKKWEASIERDDEGVQRGCREYTTGSGETAVLLIHGINDSPRCYYKMAPTLAEEGFTCRVMRLPGFAEPIQRYAQATKEQWLAAVERELRSLRQHNRRVAIVAHSLGGAVTIAYLLDNPEAVDAVVLLAPAVDVSNRRSPLLSAQTWHEIGRHSLLFTKVTSSPFPNDCHDAAEREYPGRTAFMPVAVADQTFQLIDDNRGRTGRVQDAADDGSCEGRPSHRLAGGGAVLPRGVIRGQGNLLHDGQWSRDSA